MQRTLIHFRRANTSYDLKKWTRARFPGIPAREFPGNPVKICSRFPGKNITISREFREFFLPFLAIFWHILTLFSHILTLFRTFKLFWSMNFKIFFQFHHFMCFEL